VKILQVVGARPNFIKVAPIIAALRNREGVSQILVHTGQHYDKRMSDVFFQDLGMPEEVNRVLTDRLSDLLFTPSRDGDENLLAEGIDRARIHFVGNVMIDSLRRSATSISSLSPPRRAW